MGLCLCRIPMFNPTAFPRKSEESWFKLTPPIIKLALPTSSPVSSRNLKAYTVAMPALQSRIYCIGTRESFVAYTVWRPQADRTPSQVLLGEVGVERERYRALVGISVSVKPEFGNYKTLLLDSKTGSSGNL